jgi:trigger factor
MLDLSSMQTSIKRNSPTDITLNIVLNSEELSTAKNIAVVNLSANVKVPGFREGKAPASVVEKHLDPNLLSQETLEAAVNEFYARSLVEKQLRPVKAPSITINAYVPNESLSFSAEVETIGDVEVGKYKGLNIAKEAVKVSAKDINEVIERLRNQLATRNEVNRAAKLSDEVVIDFKGVDAETKEPIAGADGSDYPLQLGSDSFIPGFEKELIGLKKDQTKSFDITFPKDYGVKALQNKVVNFTVTVKKVNERTLPPVDDALAKLVGPFSSIDELKKDIKIELTSSKEEEANTKLQNEIVEKIVNSSSVEIPKALVEEEAGRIANEHRQNAAYRGQTWNEYLLSQNLDEDKFNAFANENAEIRIKTGLVLGDIALQEKIDVAKTDVNKRIDELMTQYASDQQMQAELAKPANQQDIKNRMLVEKTVAKLVELNQAKAS